MTTASSLPGGAFQLGDQTVARVGFGAMQLAGPGVFGPPADRAEAIAVLRTAVELGVNHIDTADFYGPHVTNEIIREALAPYPDDLFIVTKVGAVRDDAGGWVLARTPADLRQQVHDNLKRLGVDALDAVNLRVGGGDDGHSAVPGSIAEQFAELAALQAEGLIRHLGLSVVNAEQLAEAQAIAPVVCVQNFYNLAGRRRPAAARADRPAGHRLRAVLPARRVQPAAVGRAERGRGPARRDPDAGRARLAAAAVAQPAADPGHVVGRAPAAERGQRRTSRWTPRRWRSLTRSAADGCRGRAASPYAGRSFFGSLLTTIA